MEENDSDGEADDDWSDEDSEEEDDDAEEYEDGEVDALTLAPWRNWVLYPAAKSIFFASQ